MLRIAIAQFRPTKGRYAENLARLGAVFAEVGAWEEPPELLVLPESALTGYFLEGGVQELALKADRLFADLAEVHAKSGAPPMDISVGFYEEHNNRLHNSSLYAALGGKDAGVVHIHRKIFLPTYGVFDEERFVEAGKTVQAFDTRWGRAAMLVCEDAWHSLTGTLAALDGAQVILIPSATPGRGIAPSENGSRPSNLARWERLAQGIAEEHGVFVAVCHLVGFEGGKGFAGGSVLLSPKGELLAEGPVFEPAIIAATLDLDEVTRARADAPLLADLESRLPYLLADRRTGGWADGDRNAPAPAKTPRVREKALKKDYPPIRPSAHPLEIDPDL
ncbi:MAG TPA: nitrilase-related carbon-nitrogen hydrolase, partial [Gemmatimonadales bacterium]|nr:nitrilase-related carbon-nitrogen hydrolase [Gemmatimonadales bacterium]